MKQFSVIIPTMWKYTPFFLFLKQILNHPSVGEVIIVNNAFRDTPLIENHPKITMLTFPENIKINPAWNYAVAHATYEHLLILNDDVVFDLGVLEGVLNFLEQGKLVMINLPHPDAPYTVTGEARIVKYQPGHRLYHIGCMMFLHRADWYPVPSGLDLYYGDTWLWGYMLEKYNENYLLENAFVDTPTNSTCGTFSDRENTYNRETALYAGMYKFYISQAVGR